jgi:predicted ATPase
MAVRGYAAPEVEQAYTRARKLCERLGDPTELFAAMLGLWAMHLVRGVLRRAHKLAEELLQRVQSAHDPALLLCAEVALGDTTFWMGEFRAAREHLEMAAKVYDPERDRPLIFRYLGVDTGVLCQGFTAHSLWNLGYPDQALKRVNEVIAMAQRLSHPLSLAYARNFAVILQQLGREARAGQESAESVVALCAEHGFTEILAYATVMRGLEMAQQGRNKEGIAQIQEGLAASRATGAELTRPSFLCVLAEVCMETGRLDDGLSAMTEALAAADQHGNRYYEAEMHRLQGELLLRQKDSNAAKAQSCFQRAIAIARRQSAKWFELRATTSLARLLRDTDRRDEARAMLAEIYRWFTEGFDTADLKSAKALLDELNG